MTTETAKHKFKSARARYGVAIAFIILALFAGVAIDHSAHSTARSTALILWKSQLKGCYRSNYLRRELNVNVLGSTMANSFVLHTFLHDASVARYASWHAAHLTADFNAAFDYEWLAVYDQDHVHFVSIQEPICRAVYPKP